MMCQHIHANARLIGLLLVMCTLAMPIPTTATPTITHFELEDQFAILHGRYNRSYSVNSTEWYTRLQHFSNNLQRYTKHSGTQDLQKLGHTAQFRPDALFDRSQDEFAMRLQHIKDYKRPQFSCTSSVTCEDLNPNTTVPNSFDWRNDKRNVITAIKDQGQCGSCWAFASVETTESAWRVAGNPAQSAEGASVQQILSCMPSDQFGCNGGYIDKALEYIASLPDGVEEAKRFKYRCSKGCTTQPACPSLAAPFISINSTCSCATLTESQMKIIVAKYGPVAVRVNADPWNGYSSGIIRYHCSALPEAGDHAVQVVGYGVDHTQGVAIPYWTVKNSWGSQWGEDGYVRLYRGDNTCGNDMKHRATRCLLIVFVLNFLFATDDTILQRTLLLLLGIANEVHFAFSTPQ
eukprot:m.18146 g.18146  ORF g.18146 m.18146 type:complete len:406 (-) comp7702_c0_seq1:205-1422(-)